MLRSQIHEMLSGSPFERGLHCDPDPAIAPRRMFGLSPPLGGELLTHAPVLPAGSEPAQQEQLARLDLPTRSLRMTTRQLWPTLVSVVELAGPSGTDTAFMDRLNLAALSSYGRFL